MRSFNCFLFAVVLAACNVSMAGKTPASGERAASVQITKTPLTSSLGTKLASDNLFRDSYYECAASNDGATWDIQACIEEEFVYQDSKLNSTYKALLSQLPREEKESMKMEERTWVAEKEAACKWDAETEGQAQRIEANLCSLEKTATRARYLEELLQNLPPT